MGEGEGEEEDRHGLVGRATTTTLITHCPHISHTHAPHLSFTHTHSPRPAHSHTSPHLMVSSV